MKHILTGLTALLLIPVWPAHGEVEGGNFKVLYERTFRGCTAVLAATDRFLFISDSGCAPDDSRPDGAAIQAEDGTIKGYSPLFKQSVIRLLLCDRATGGIMHEFSGPVSRNPRVSGFELSLTSPPVMLEDGFAFLTADWHLQRIELPAGDGGPVRLWDLDIPVATALTPRLSDDMGYLMPVVSRCGGTLLFTFNSAPSGERAPVHITMAAVSLTDGRLRWTRTLGPSGAVDRSPSCVPLGPDRFAVVTATGDVQTFSIDGTLLHAVRPAGEFRPADAATRMAGPLWELQRLDARRLIVFSGESPELGRNVSSPVCCLGIEQEEAMKCLWTSFKTRGPVAPAAVGSNIYLRNASGLTAYSPETGKALWDKTNEDAAINCAWSAPLVHGGFVYLATEDGLAVYRDAAECVPVGTVEFTDRKPGRSAYTSDMPHGYAPPVIYDGTLYVTANAKLLALKLPLFP